MQPLTWRMQPFPQGLWIFAQDPQGAPFATGNLGPSFRTSQSLEKAKLTGGPQKLSVWIPCQGSEACLPWRPPCLSGAHHFFNSTESSRGQAQYPCFFPKPLAESWVVSSQLTGSTYCFRSFSRKHSLIRSFLP